MELDQEYSKEELNFSRPLDRHRISEHPEVKTFLKDFQQTYFPKYGKPRREMLDVLLMDLYINWYYNQDMFVGLHRDVTAYKKSKRLNKLRITRTIILVADDLISSGFIYWHKGYDGDYNSKISRIKANPKLEAIFQEASFNVLDITDHSERETIILKDVVYEETKEGKEIKTKPIIEYEDTNLTVSMRHDLNAYNDLIHRTHVDIGNLNRPYIERRKGRKQKKASKVAISQHNKFTYRVFNNASWDNGGRFYGAWWQSIGSEHRQHIRLHGERVVETDVSGIHIILLYARKDIVYTETGIGDCYAVDVSEVDDAQARRWLVKQVFLLAVNAIDVPTTCSAVRQKVRQELPEYIELPDIKLDNKFITSIIDKLRDKHPLIAEFLCTGAGIELQNTDSQITSFILNHFTKRNVPCLSIHDSYIVPEQYNLELFDTIQEAFANVTGLTSELWGETSAANVHTPVVQDGYVDELIDPEEPGGGIEHQEMLTLKDKHLVVLPAYKRRLKDFQTWLSKTDG
jgi:hypothetical protein